ncbi:MAG: phosphate acyltransferase, partial [Clostridiales bacterium]|nr:phosphate acyltransferase [Clostridiales bacterium]
MMRIALDIMGGDHAPEEILLGAREALAMLDELELILVGDKDAIMAHFPQSQGNPRIEIVHSTEVIGMDEHPAMAYRKKKDASITVASNLVLERRAQAVVSAGSTGAQLAAGLFEIGRMRGVARPAIATCIPTLQGPKVILDVGANADCTAENLRQFAWLGKIYSEIALEIDNPRVFLLNNGTEEEKGNELTLNAYALLKGEAGLGFCGSIEGREMFNGD